MAKFSPHIVELTGEFDSAEAFQQLAYRPYCIFLDSARHLPGLGRYSFIGCDPYKVIQSSPSTASTAAGSGRQDVDMLAELELDLSELHSVRDELLPPFQGGAMGIWSYDLVRSIEQIAPNAFDEFQVPFLCVGLYDVVLSFDHEQNRSWLISQGFPETDPTRRLQRAERRSKEFLNWLRAPRRRVADQSNDAHRRGKLEPSGMAPMFPTRHPGIFSNFADDQYQQTIARVIEYIHAGDAFQVNLAQRLLCESKSNPVALYMKLRERNAAPFAGYFDLGEHQIISASPERFLRIDNRQVEARPVKGTRQRSTLPEADLFGGAELQASRKDLSENVMIVDLMRNDLSRVCEDDSVQVTKLCGLETYKYVQHLVSVIEGTLRANCSPIDVIRAAFPGGSITGAPKVRAMEIISELEPTARGAYCGSLGYIGFDGATDLSILIRTITASHGWWQFPVGGGIVADSNPAAEFEETWHKAAGMLHAIL